MSAVACVLDSLSYASFRSLCRMCCRLAGGLLGLFLFWTSAGLLLLAGSLGSGLRSSCVWFMLVLGRCCSIYFHSGRKLCLILRESALASSCKYTAWMLARRCDSRFRRATGLVFIPQRD